MKEKETSKLYNSITNVNNQFIEEAQAINHKKKVKKSGWLKWGAVVACFVAVVLYIGLFQGDGLFGNNTNIATLDNGNIDGNPAGYEQTADIAPMICINRALYQIVGNQPDLVGKEDEFSYIGEISSKVGSSQKPTEDFQANDDIVGSKVYQYDECIVVEINGQYWLYELLYEYQK